VKPANAESLKPAKAESVKPAKAGGAEAEGAKAERMTVLSLPSTTSAQCSQVIR
jgi:hypothetical protein